jgi:hypothetical protein
MLISADYVARRRWSRAPHAQRDDIEVIAVTPGAASPFSRSPSSAAGAGQAENADRRTRSEGVVPRSVADRGTFTRCAASLIWSVQGVGRAGNDDT